MGLLSRFSGVPAITPAATAAGVRDGSLLLVDVRERAEYLGGHVREARHIPLAALGEQLDALARDGRPVAFVCASGMRSGRAARMARAAGIEASNVKGGMLAWQRDGLPVRR